jgi:uncharacterized protein (DUF362 family)
MRKISRRRFIQNGLRVAGGAAIAGLPGCLGPVRDTPNDGFLGLPLSPPGRAVLGFYESSEMAEICEEVVPQITDLAWLSSGDSVFVKVACNSAKPHPAVTSPEAVKGLVRFLRDHGAGTVYVGDQAGVEHVRLTTTERKSSTRAAMTSNGLLAAVEDAGARLHCFDDQGWEGYLQTEADFEDQWKGGLWLPKILGEVDHVINLPRLGSHGISGYTCGVKSAVGWLRDDSRLQLHQRGERFFEQMAEISHFRPLRDKLRFTLTLGEKALLNIGPDLGSEYDFGGVLALGAERLVDHDLLASSLLPWLDGDEISFFDLYHPYPRHSDWWNRYLLRTTWGKEAEAGSTQLIPYHPEKGLAFDRCLSHLATLQRYRPERIVVDRGDEPLPEGLLSHLREFDGGVFSV